MKTKPFDLEAAKNGAKVVTRDGRPARIVCFDAKSYYPIIALISNSKEHEYQQAYTKYGRYTDNIKEHKDDLFLVDETEPELTEFEQAVFGYLFTDKNDMTVDLSKQVSEQLLSIARKEMQKEQKPTPVWMLKFLDELRSKKNYFDWDEHRDIEGHILAIINWIAPDYFDRKWKGQKSDTRDADDLQLLGFIYDLLASLDWRENYAMSKEECLRRLNDYRPQKPAEWSEEDEKMLEILISNYEFLSKKYRDEEKDFFCSLSIVQDDLDMSEWLESRFKSLRPQPHWKPSEEQMNALAWYSGNSNIPPVGDKAIKSLYNDLKKLM